MLNQRYKSLSYSLGLSLGVALLFLFFLPHVLRYQEQYTIFLLRSNYWIEELKVPGGFTNILSDFIIQFSYYPALGAALYGLVMGAICYLQISTVHKLCPDKANSGSLIALAMIVPLYLVWNMMSYRFGLWTASALLLNLVAVRLTLITGSRLWRFVLTIGLGFAMYALTQMSFAYFIGMCIMISLFERRYYLSLALLPVLYVAPWAWSYYFILPQSAFFYYEDTVTSVWITLGIFTTLYMSAVRFLPEKIGSKRFAEYALLAVVILGFGYGVYTRDISQERLYARIQSCIDNEEWDELFELTRVNSQRDPVAIYAANLALAKNGHMGEAMFDFDNCYAHDGLYYYQLNEWGSHFFAAVGSYNESIHWNFEMLTRFGNGPLFLQNMVKENLANNKESVAKHFQRILDGSLFYRKDTAQWHKLKAYAQDTMCPVVLPHDRELFIDVFNPGMDLFRICQRDSSNRVAFDYLAAYILLQKKPKEFARQFGLAKHHYGERLPRIYEEAILSYQLSNPSVDEFPEAMAYKVSGTTRRAFDEYFSIYSSTQPQYRMAALKQKFGNTFWFYLHFIQPVPKEQ